MTPIQAIKSAKQIVTLKLSELQAEVAPYGHTPDAPHFIRHKRRIIKDYISLLERAQPTPADKEILVEVLRQRADQSAFAARLFRFRPDDASEDIKAEALEWDKCTEAYSVLRY